MNLDTFKALILLFKKGEDKAGFLKRVQSKKSKIKINSENLNKAYNLFAAFQILELDYLGKKELKFLKKVFDEEVKNAKKTGSVNSKVISNTKASDKNFKSLSLSAKNSSKEKKQKYNKLFSSIEPAKKSYAKIKDVATLPQSEQSTEIVSAAMINLDRLMKTFSLNLLPGPSLNVGFNLSPTFIVNFIRLKKHFKELYQLLERLNVDLIKANKDNTNKIAAVLNEGNKKLISSSKKNTSKLLKHSDSNLKKLKTNLDANTKSLIDSNLESTEALGKTLVAKQDEIKSTHKAIAKDLESVIGISGKLVSSSISGEHNSVVASIDKNYNNLKSTISYYAISAFISTFSIVIYLFTFYSIIGAYCFRKEIPFPFEGLEIDFYIINFLLILFVFIFNFFNNLSKVFKNSKIALKRKKTNESDLDYCFHLLKKLILLLVSVVMLFVIILLSVSFENFENDIYKNIAYSLFSIFIICIFAGITLLSLRLFFKNMHQLFFTTSVIVIALLFSGIVINFELVDSFLSKTKLGGDLNISVTTNSQSSTLNGTVTSGKLLLKTKKYLYIDEIYKSGPTAINLSNVYAIDYLNESVAGLIFDSKDFEALSLVPDTQINKLSFAFDFEHNSAELSDENYTQLKLLAQIVNEKYKLANISVIGKADNSGTKFYNYALGKKRAENIAHLLSANGLQINTTKSEGEDNFDADKLDSQRIVEVIYLIKTQCFTSATNCKFILQFVFVIDC